MKRNLLLSVVFMSVGAGCHVQAGGGDSSSAPVITRVVFPEQMPGDGSVVEGTVRFTDEEGDIDIAYMEVIECPPSAVCTGGEMELNEGTDVFEGATQGSFGFGLTCTNEGYDSLFFEWQLTLIDKRNLQSVPETLEIECLPE